MSARTAVTAVVALVLGTFAGPAHAKRTRDVQPASCPAGRFLIAATRSYHTGIPPDEVVEVGDGEVTLGPACGAAPAAVRRRAGGLVVRAKWKTCGPRKRVVLVARVAAPDCGAMDGTIRQVGFRLRFTASRSRCGDGRWDAATEACDAGVGCPSGFACAADCTCPGAPTTTTTVPGVTTTTLAPATCTTVEVPYEGGYHVAEGTPITYQHNPPASGNHYPVWARWEDLPVPIARGYWVHNLEHGGVVIVYQPNQPTDVTSVLHAAYAAIPLDPICTQDNRTVMTADPELDAPWAVVAHDLVMECDRPDVDAIVQWAVANRDHGPELDCRPGLRP